MTHDKFDNILHDAVAQMLIVYVYFLQFLLGIVAFFLSFFLSIYR